MATRKYTKAEQKERFSKKIVRFIIWSNCIFALIVFGVTLTGNLVPDSLVISWFAFTGTELFALAGIKINDTQYGADTDDSDEKPVEGENDKWTQE